MSEIWSGALLIQPELRHSGLVLYLIAAAESVQS